MYILSYFFLNVRIETRLQDLLDIFTERKLRKVFSKLFSFLLNASLGKVLYSKFYA